MSKTVLWAVCLIAAGQGPPPAAPSTPPRPRLSDSVYPAGVADEAAYVDYLAARTRSLIDAADAAAEPPAEARGRLAAANWILARQIEPAVSRVLLGIPAASDNEVIREGIARAARQLAAAESALARAPAAAAEVRRSADARDAPQPPLTEALQSTLTDLSAFADALAVAFSDEMGGNSEDRARAAASSLAILLEDERPGVAVCATLMQALLYHRAGQMDRTRTVLDLALQAVPGDAREVAFYSRLLRCRYLAEEGRFAVACSLLLKLEERCFEWFVSATDQAEAGYAATLVRRQTIQAWRDGHQGPEADAHRQWCDAAIARIEEALAGEPQPIRLMRLRSAVPYLLDVEAAFEQPSAGPDGP